MPAYRKQLYDKDGNRIYPITGTSGSVAGMIILSAADGGNPIPSGTQVEFSHETYMGTKALDYEYDPYNILEMKAGTVAYTHNPNIRFIEAEVTYTGNGYGMWYSRTGSQKNYNPLNGAVVCNANEKILKTFGGTRSGIDYGGCTFKTIYDVSGMTEGEWFYVNPVVATYGSDVYMSRGGTVSQMVVKAYYK